jgi:putative transposase
VQPGHNVSVDHGLGVSDNVWLRAVRLVGMPRFQLLSDEQWALTKDLLPVRTGKRGRPFSNTKIISKARSSMV